MKNSIDEFKKFVKSYPRLRTEVRDGKRSWQSIYEEWVLLGDDGSWDTYKVDQETKIDSSEGQELLKKALGYVKKINPDDITKTIGSVQKVLSIVQTFSGGKAKQQNKIMYPQRRRVDPLFRRFDDYDE